MRVVAFLQQLLLLRFLRRRGVQHAVDHCGKCKNNRQRIRNYTEGKYIRPDQIRFYITPKISTGINRTTTVMIPPMTDSFVISLALSISARMSLFRSTSHLVLLCQTLLIPHRVKPDSLPGAAGKPFLQARFIYIFIHPPAEKTSFPPQFFQIFIIFPRKFIEKKQETHPLIRTHFPSNGDDLRRPIRHGIIRFRTALFSRAPPRPRTAQSLRRMKV